MPKQDRGLRELYLDDPERADARLFGRRPELSRRGFLGGSGLAALSTVLGAHLPFARRFPGGLIPAALAQSTEPFAIPGKDPGLRVINDAPLSVETPAYLLDDFVTPASRMYVRNNGIAPTDLDASTWTLTIDGESVEEPQTFTLQELRSDFEHHTLHLHVECAGNGRSEFYPPASGNQWTTGAIGCPEWTGIRVRDLLARVPVKDDAVYVAYYGADRHSSGDDRVPISRGVPMAKALADETLLAWEMNGEALPAIHGYPLRLVCAGWPGSTSGKWVKRLAIRDREHDGPKMTGQSYRIPRETVAPGTQVPDNEMKVLEAMPVKSLITHPRSGLVHRLGTALEVGGHAWVGEGRVSEVFVSKDFGASWQPARLEAPRNLLGWQRFSAAVTFPGVGYYEIWARAVDDSGISQPMVVPGWNPRGYLNNACHRIAVRVA